MTTRTLSILRTHDDREIPVAGAYTIDPAHTSGMLVGRKVRIELNVQAVASARP